MTEYTQALRETSPQIWRPLEQEVAHLTERLGILVQHQTTDRVYAAASEVEASIRRGRVADGLGSLESRFILRLAA